MHAQCVQNPVVVIPQRFFDDFRALAALRFFFSRTSFVGHMLTLKKGVLYPSVGNCVESGSTRSPIVAKL